MFAKLGETRGATPGPFVDSAERRLGTHRGIARYTVGQRRGLGIAAAAPLYVIEIDAARNTIVLGPRAALARTGLVADCANWLLPSPVTAGARAHVKIRYQHVPAPASLHPGANGSVEVRFDEPQTAI